MIYMKHPELGNKHFDDAEQAEREAEGWVKWPRSKEAKFGAVAVPVFVLPTVEAGEHLEVRRPGRPRKVQP
jgi:hypothetical protein